MKIDINAMPALDFEAGIRNFSEDSSCLEAVTVIIAVMIFELFK
ncbi:MAG TPA: hypothetical protein VEZ70_03955 [Allosphingosinicella sp.]|jgi:hypothetical protein|nr:hypothetical protein [Allosphingosinicella sp.]